MADELGCEYEFLATKKGDGEQWMQKIRSVNPDVLLTVPGVISALLNENWVVPKMIFGGYSPKAHDFQRYSGHCDVMIQGYGQTEAGGLISCHKMSSDKEISADEHLCCGSPIKGVEIFCDGSADQPAQIWIRSETAFTTKKYFSGDLGYRDDLGKIYITGRAKQTVKEK